MNTTIKERGNDVIVALFANLPARPRLQTFVMPLLSEFAITGAQWISWLGTVERTVKWKQSPVRADVAEVARRQQRQAHLVEVLSRVVYRG